MTQSGPGPVTACRSSIDLRQQLPAARQYTQATQLVHPRTFCSLPSPTGTLSMMA
ncbi:hypothetical protein C4K39_6284 [Pseudomonas sessilinigenes]|nr:hypothetical protein C4K39_6284 [Pseudomonas sessilinigenes]